MMRKPGLTLLFLWGAFLFFAFGASPDHKKSTPPNPAKEQEDTNTSPEFIDDDIPEEESNDPSFDPDSIDLTGQNLTEIACLSVGSPNRGRLINGISLATEPGINVRNPERTYGTPETIAAIRFAVAKVNQELPGAPSLVIGDISRAGGGRLGSHRSHQSGRDVDLGYYPKDGSNRQFFFNATEGNMDLPRTWALLQGLLEDDKTQYVFVDRSVQKVLIDYAKYELQLPEDKICELFESACRNKYAKIRHVRGHKNHIHVRFNSPVAVMAATQGNFDFSGHRHFPTKITSSFSVRMSETQAAPVLGRMDDSSGASPTTLQRPVWAKIRTGDNLWLIARRNNTTVDKLCRLNGMNKKSKLHPGQSIKVGIVTERVPAKDKVRLAGKAGGKKNGPDGSIDRQKAGAGPNPPAKLADARQSDSFSSSAYYVVRGQRLYSITPLFGMRITNDCRWLLFSESAR